MTLLFIVAIFVFISCNNEANNEPAQADTIKKEVIHKTPNNEDDFGTITLEEAIHSFEASYKEIVAIDTVIYRGSDTLALKFDYHVTDDHDIVVPEKFVSLFNETQKEYTAHSFISYLSIVKNGIPVYDSKIDKTQFRELLETDKFLYAVMLNPVFTVTETHILICYYISIPVTDLTAVCYIAIDLANGSVKVNRE